MAEPPPSENLFLSDLPADIDEEAIQEVFGSYGTIQSCKAIAAKAPGQKAAALIRFANVQEAQNVRDTFNGNIPDGWPDPITVRFANPRGPAARKAQDMPQLVPPPEPFNDPVKRLTNLERPSAPRLYPLGTVPPPPTTPPPAPLGPPPSENLFMSELPGDIDESTIYHVFGGYGNIQSCKAIPSRAPGQKGAALVRFASVQEAQLVLEQFDGNIPEIWSEPIVVRFANPRHKGEAPAGASYGRSVPPPARPAAGPYAAAAAARAGAAGQPAPGVSPGACDIRTLLAGLFAAGAVPGATRSDDRCLYIRGLPRDTTDVDLYKMFSPFGALAQKGVTAMANPDGSCTGIGFVDFVDPAAMQAAALALNGTQLPDGVVLQVQEKAPSKKKLAAGR